MIADLADIDRKAVLHGHELALFFRKSISSLVVRLSALHM